MSFNPYEYKMPTECEFQGVLYVDIFFPPSVRESVKKFKGHPSDIMLTAYPKTGVTWTSAMLDHILNDGEIEKAKGHILKKMPYIEGVAPDGNPSAAQMQEQEPPRVFKTHLRYEFLKRQIEEDKVKSIIVLRNPKDTLVSYYHFYKIANAFGNFPGSFHDFFEMFKVKRLAFGDIFEWYRDWWMVRDLENVLVLKYEDMIQDALATAKTLTKFIGKELSEEALQKVVTACSFKEMKKDPKTSMEKVSLFDQSKGNFYRKGGIGDWRNHFTDEENDIVDAKCREYFEPVGLEFEY